MIDKLKSWQRENGQGEYEKPFFNEWYWDLRVEIIKAGYLTKAHGKDVCRSFIKYWLKDKQKTA